MVLAIAKNVRSILRNHGIDARLTRFLDTFIPLYDRVETADKHGAICLCQFMPMALRTPAARVRYSPSNCGASSAMAKYLLCQRENRADW